MVVWDYGVLAAAEDKNQAAVQTLGYTWYFGWAGMAVGIGAAFLVTGLGGVRNAVLPRWFARTTTVMGGSRAARRLPPSRLAAW